MSSRVQVFLWILGLLVLTLGAVVGYRFLTQAPTQVVTPGTVEAGDEYVVTKTASAAAAEPGDTITYTISYTWFGPGYFPAATLVDDYQETDIATVQNISTGGIDNGTTITWDLGQLDATQGPASGTVTYTATLLDSYPTLPRTITNTVAFSSIEFPDPALDSAQVTVQGVITGGQPELTIDKQVIDVNGGSVERGDQLQYTVVVGNTGDGDSTNVQVVDNVGVFLENFTVTQVPAGATDQSTPVGGTNGNGLLKIVGFNLAAGATASMSYSATVEATAPNNQRIDNVAVATDDQGNNVSDQASVLVIVPGGPVLQASPQLGIVKNVEDVNGGSVERGDTLRYSITVANSGAGTATGITVVDDVGRYLEQFSVETVPTGAVDQSQPAPAGANGAGQLLVSGFSLASGNQALITYTVVVSAEAPDGQAVRNVAIATDDQGESVQDDAAITPAVPAPTVEVLPVSPTVTGGQTPPTTTPAPTTEPTATVVPTTGPADALWIAVAIAAAITVLGSIGFIFVRVLR